MKGPVFKDPENDGFRSWVNGLLKSCIRRGAPIEVMQDAVFEDFFSTELTSLGLVQRDPSLLLVHYSDLPVARTVYSREQKAIPEREKYNTGTPISEQELGGEDTPWRPLSEIGDYGHVFFRRGRAGVVWEWPPKLRVLVMSGEVLPTFGGLPFQADTLLAAMKRAGVPHWRISGPHDQEENVEAVFTHRDVISNVRGKMENRRKLLSRVCADMLFGHSPN